VDSEVYRCDGYLDRWGLNESAKHPCLLLSTGQEEGGDEGYEIFIIMEPYRTTGGMQVHGYWDCS
jgi:hypothetical protein